jgi:hypothetical protein
MGLRAGVDEIDRRKSCPYWDSSSDLSAILLVSSRFIDCAKFNISAGAFSYTQNLL